MDAPRGNIKRYEEKHVSGIASTVRLVSHFGDSDSILLSPTEPPPVRIGYLLYVLLSPFISGSSSWDSTSDSSGGLFL